MKRSSYSVMALLIVMLTVAGCGFLNFGLNSHAVTITVNLDEGTLNTLLTQAQESVVAANGEALLAQITHIDFMAPDTIRVSGAHNQNGSAVEGSFDLRTTLEEGALKAAISAVNIPGYSLDSPAIQKINQELSAAFTEQLRHQHEGAIANVQVTSDALTIVFEVPFR